MGKIKTPLPSSREITEAIGKLSAAMSKIDVKYGLIGGSAVLTYADHYGLPKRLTAGIDLIIQPDIETKISAEEVLCRLCSDQFSEHFAVKRLFGVDIPQVQVYDHHNCPERRTDYDLRLKGNELVDLLVDGHKVFLLNAPWILRQKILTWSDRKGQKMKKNKIDIETLCDVLSGAMMTLKISGERDIRKLRDFLKDFEHDPRALGAVIDCPETFGPWYDLKWVRRTFACILFLAVPLAVDCFMSTTGQILGRR
jgi:hypothetical protein